MKWFKHFTLARQDEALLALREDFGVEGYGRYFLILEVVAGRSKDDSFEVALPMNEWAAILGTKQNKLHRFIERAENLRLFTTERTGKILKIAVPKLAEIRDEYSRRSGQSRSKHRSVDKETDSEERQIQCRSPQPPKGAIEVFENWRMLFDHPDAKLDAKRRRCIESALKKYTPEQLCRALQGYTHSPHHMGATNGTRYDQITLLLRDSEHIERGLGFYLQPPRPPNPNDQILAASITTGQEWLAHHEQGDKT